MTISFLAIYRFSGVFTVCQHNVPIGVTTLLKWLFHALPSALASGKTEVLGRTRKNSLSDDHGVEKKNV